MPIEQLYPTRTTRASHWTSRLANDDDNGTAFAARFDVENPDDAPTMHEVEAEWLMHKARKKPPCPPRRSAQAAR